MNRQQEPLMIERIDAQPYEPGRFLNHLAAAAQATGAPFNEAIVRQTLDVFDAEFRRCVVQLKTTCQENTGIYYRFFYKWERDLTALAQQHGLIASAQHKSESDTSAADASATALVDLQYQVLENCAGATRAGLDFDTSYGLAKVWTFTGGPVPVQKIAELPAVPEAVRQHLGFFERHGLRHVFFVASDHQQNSMNVYFGLEEDCRSAEWIAALAAETGGAPEDPAIYQQMLASLAVSTGVGATFRWDTGEMGRWCLYGLNVPERPSPGSNLPELPARLKRFQQHAATLNASPQYNVAWSFGKAGFYTKLEKSYAKDADYFLTCEMGGALSRADNPTRADNRAG